jgi:hypothetical protein
MRTMLPLAKSWTVRPSVPRGLTTDWLPKRTSPATFSVVGPSKTMSVLRPVRRLQSV